MTPRVYPGATYAPIPEAETQTPITPVLIILHTIVGSAAGAERIMRGDSGSIESHFVLPFDGKARQLMPLDRRADCNWRANSWPTRTPLNLVGRVIPTGTVCGAISIETEDDGTPDDTPWTPAQIEWIARFAAWAHDELGIPLTVPASPFDAGIGYHSLPGKNTLAIWDTPGMVPPYGTITDAKGRTVNVYNPYTTAVGKGCPGPARIAQFPALVGLARSYTRSTPTPPPTPTEDDMPRLIQPTHDAAVFLLDGLVATWVRDGNVLAALAPLVSPGVTTVDRLALHALELHGPAPAYGVTPPDQPERTVASDFAVWRP